MPLVQISKPRPGILRLRAALRILPGPRAAVWPMVLAWFLICGMLAFLPGWWITDWRERTLDHWFEVTHGQASRLTQEWEHWTVPVPQFTAGDEQVVRTWLSRETLVTALVDSCTEQVWIREGSRLRLAKGEAEAQEPADWTRRALEACPVWAASGPIAVMGRARNASAFNMGTGWLAANADAHAKTECSIVTFDRKWCLIKRWVPGSPEVERWLQGTLGPGASYRFGVVSGFHWPHNLSHAIKASDLGRLASLDTLAPLQATNPNDAPFRLDESLSRSFSGNWQCALQMAPEAYRTFLRAYLRRQRLAWTSYALVVAASGLALSLVLFARNREKILADRLATLTHSLKTPLAVLKLRCDTALNNDLSRASQEARLLEIRGEVDQLVRTIEGGLEEMRTRYTGRGMDRVDGDFFERLDEDLTPAFEAQGRMLEVYGGEVTFRCCATVLRAALATLVENALMHGQGRVTVRAARQGATVAVTVADEGEGLSEGQLAGLKSGTPSRTSPAPARPGEGMGLQVLVRIVRQEGWGLAFERAATGFSATLGIPA